ncbi:MAG: PspC domain-containing protein [Clostridia bacterium]|nr:PspC domain-containing protein [Clostridia bacterium]
MKTLHKSSNKMICGVCGGIAEYFGIDPTLVRLGFVACSIVFGSGLLAYIAAAIIMPEAQKEYTAEIIRPADAHSAE